jgi:CxxC motif-containing protein (DUF1111 family)
MPAPGLTPAEMSQHLRGDANFDAVFVTAPARVNPGLGPKFNNSSCSGCHLNDGRGMPQLGQALVRVSLPQGNPEVPGGAVPLPEIGTQIRDRAVFGHRPDAQVNLTWQTQTGQYSDGSHYQLRSPQLQLTETDPGNPLPAKVQQSLRVPPPVFGVGLLEAIPAATLEANADPSDRDRNQISGRANYVWDQQHRQKVLGRFGLKANTSSLLIQTAAAYHNDMGISNPLFPGPQNQTEVDQPTLEATVFYLQTLGVPAQLQTQTSQVRAGERIFNQLNCNGCHLSTLKTGPAQLPILANQTIHPYTDLLLHDMGTGLADQRPDGEANGQEWRTPPLWGIGLSQTVLPYSGYLHDGRARTLEEAILWHGGEAQTAQVQFKSLTKGKRQALLAFLRSL